MNFLDNRIPPPLVALIAAVLMWIAAQWFLPATGLPNVLRYGAAAVLLLLGLASSISGARTFRRAGTTLNPMRIENASALVTGGIYRITRNPMYLGLTLALSAWAFFLGCLWTLAGPVIFIGYITAFQIVPEERALAAKFGDSYRDYCRRVRRWL
jgi:protein-S-isoprenylcysteine O-methyltransferase Ste14